VAHDVNQGGGRGPPRPKSPPERTVSHLRPRQCRQRDLPPNDQRVLIAKMIEFTISGALSWTAVQAFALCGQVVQQQQQAAAQENQQADPAAEAVVAEAATALGGNG
jgi:hypothetical protein